MREIEQLVRLQAALPWLIAAGVALYFARLWVPPKRRTYDVVLEAEKVAGAVIAGR